MLQAGIHGFIWNYNMGLLCICTLYPPHPQYTTMNYNRTPLHLQVVTGENVVLKVGRSSAANKMAYEITVIVRLTA